ncbi:hypothetical protein F5X68DRAFT_204305 [Plectosphaerella plurivora]|uniref:Ahmp1 protein n=1 Tax=Plectosphaerella plurivora TaxID=936078 RepID=A0A9P8VFB3_9PEZI|nr:hypothetical protein F5X68DRAFT_204305 [Plectosphaerella plurivora]
MNHSRRSSNDPSADPVVGRPRGDSTVDRSALTSWASRSSLHAPSFQAAEDAGTEAFPFPPLTDSPTSPRSARRGGGNGGGGGPPSIRDPSPATRDRPDFLRRPSNNPSIRIRRRSNASLRAPAERSSFPDLSAQSLAEHNNSLPPAPPGLPGQQIGRPRSSSHPERGQVPRNDANIARHSRAVPQVAMPRLTEEGTRPTMEELGMTPSPGGRSDDHPLSPVRSLPQEHTAHQPHHTGMVRKVSKFFWPGRGESHRQQASQHSGPASQSQDADTEYDDQLVDWLDVVDPEVQTLSTLTNIQNSLFVPDLGRWVNRRPTYVLSDADAASLRPRTATGISRRPTTAQEPEKRGVAGESLLIPPPIERTSTISSRLTESHYAALPHGTTLEGWTAEDKELLDDHVRHMLHSRRSKFKRSMKGFGQYVRRPLGFAVTLYATLITLFGLAWVLFLIGWIYVPGKQEYVIHIIDSVLVALFAIVGDGLAPFRAVDTYRMIYIAHYSRIIEKAKQGKLQKRRSRLQKRGVTPELRESMDMWTSIDPPGVPSNVPVPVEVPRPTHTRDDIPPEEDDDEVARTDFSRQVSQQRSMNQSPGDLESAKFDDDAEELWPLTPAQRRKFRYQQQKFAKSHSFYKPHETDTHSPFPLGYLIAVVILLDCHSCLQISLGACTWGIDYHTRPFALTTVILCVSITTNITAGLVITIGDRKTRKKEVHKLMNRQELTGEAIKKIDKKRDKEREAEEEAAAAGAAASAPPATATTASSEQSEKRKNSGLGKLRKERSE